MRFTVLTDFYSEELKSYYVAGLGYKITEKNKALVEQWVKDGKVSLGGPAAKVAAHGEVGG